MSSHSPASCHYLVVSLTNVSPGYIQYTALPHSVLVGLLFLFLSGPVPPTTNSSVLNKPSALDQRLSGAAFTNTHSLKTVGLICKDRVDSLQIVPLLNPVSSLIKKNIIISVSIPVHLFNFLFGRRVIPATRQQRHHLYP